MTIGSHLETFAGRRVVDFGPPPGDQPEGHGEPAEVAWRVRVGPWEDGYERFEERFGRFLATVDPATVQALIIGAWGHAMHRGGDSAEGPLRLLTGAADRLTALEALFSGEMVMEEAEISWIPQTNVTPLLDAFPRSRLRDPVEDVVRRLTGSGQPLFLLLNVAALHQPNHFYLPGATSDSLASHAAALEYVDRHLGRLFALVSRDRPCFAVVCSDHGTAYGEDGHSGHRIGHEVVWTVPYAQFTIQPGTWDH